LADLSNLCVVELYETATGQTRMSDNGGRRSARRKDLDGEKLLAECIEQLPRMTDLEKARAAREKAVLASALASGGVNARASELLATVADGLAYWVRVLCEERGVDYSPVQVPSTAYGARYAAWLAVYVAAIAASPDAGDITTDIEGWRDDIETAVNRPVRQKYLGPCPTQLDGEDCGLELTAPPEAIETYCRRCKTTHNVNRVSMVILASGRLRELPWERILDFNRKVPREFQVPPRTLRWWRQSDRIKPFRMCDGVPLYRWADVETLRAKVGVR